MCLVHRNGNRKLRLSLVRIHFANFTLPDWFCLKLQVLHEMAGRAPVDKDELVELEARLISSPQHRARFAYLAASPASAVPSSQQPGKAYAPVRSDDPDIVIELASEHPIPSPVAAAERDFAHSPRAFPNSYFGLDRKRLLSPASSDSPASSAHSRRTPRLEDYLTRFPERESSEFVRSYYFQPLMQTVRDSSCSMQ